MNTRRTDGRETWSRLLDWDKGQAPSERLASTLLHSDGYAGVDPSHPLGGKDGGKDAIVRKDGLKLVLAAYFPRGQQNFKAITDKFDDDFKGVAKNDADGIVFFTNQELRLGERSTLTASGQGKTVEIYHLERLATLLNSPTNYGIRLEFLDIAMTNEEVLALYAQRDKDHLEQLAGITKALDKATERLIGHTTGGDSYLRFDLRPKSGNIVEVSAYIESRQPHSPGKYPLSSVDISIMSDNDQIVRSFSGQDLHLGIVQKFPDIQLPNDRTFKFFNIKVHAKNGHYQQYFMLKKFADGNWYFHALRWNDLHNFTLRQEEFQSGYPDQLKLMRPLINEYRPADIDPNRTLDDWGGKKIKYDDMVYGL